MTSDIIDVSGNIYLICETVSNSEVYFCNRIVILMDKNINNFLNSAGQLIVFPANRKMAELKLQNAATIDLENVNQLYKSVIGQHGCTWNDKYPAMEDILNDYNTGCLYVLRSSDSTVGAVSVVPQNELDDISCWKVADGTQKEIARVVISPEYQGKGYAKQMLLQLFSILSYQGCKSIHLLVSKGNLSAVNLYKKLNFDFLGECYRYEHDFFICEKKLTCLL